MTLAELNGHLDLVQQLQKTEELIQGLWNAAVPGAQKLDGMPHAGGVRHNSQFFCYFIFSNFF